MIMCVPVLDIKINSLKFKIYLFLYSSEDSIKSLCKIWKNSVNSFLICAKENTVQGKTLIKILFSYK